jgi:alpha-1,2-rhamnosyltransferase
MKHKIYIDCTHTYYSGLNTGIQRVVRSIIKNSFSIDKNIKIIPVVLSGTSYMQVEELPTNSFTSEKIGFKNLLKKSYSKIRNYLKIIPFCGKILYSPIVTSYLNKTYDVLTANKKRTLKGEKAVFSKNDILLLLDSTWFDSNFKYLKKLKDEDVKIISVMYDLIPITHSQYCSDDLAKMFGLWFEKIYPLAHGFITISKTVENELIDYMKKKNYDYKEKSIDYFVLGVDFKKSEESSFDFNEKFKNMFGKEKTFITVSTLEPRKNHAFILDTFDMLWEKGYDYNYVIIGRIGWKVDDLLYRIKKHKELNKRLFLLDRVDDNALMYAYQNSKAMIFASHVEGFGLPIIESLYYNLQVLSSNIPIHNEVGKDFVTYFDLNDKKSLFSIIEQDSFYKNLDNFQWYNWSQSTQQLIEKSLKMANNI